MNAFVNLGADGGRAEEEDALDFGQFDIGEFDFGHFDCFLCGVPIFLVIVTLRCGCFQGVLCVCGCWFLVWMLVSRVW